MLQSDSSESKWSGYSLSTKDSSMPESLAVALSDISTRALTSDSAEAQCLDLSKGKPISKRSNPVNLVMRKNITDRRRSNRVVMEAEFNDVDTPEGSPDSDRCSKKDDCLSQFDLRLKERFKSGTLDSDYPSKKDDCMNQFDSKLKERFKKVFSSSASTISSVINIHQRKQNAVESKCLFPTTTVEGKLRDIMSTDSLRDKSLPYPDFLLVKKAEEISKGMKPSPHLKSSALDYPNFLLTKKAEELSKGLKSSESRVDYNTSSPGRKVERRIGPRKSDKVLQDLKERDREQRKTLVLWKKPLQTLKHFVLELKHQLWEGFNKLLSSKWIMSLLCVATLLYFLSISFRGSHTEYLQKWTAQFQWCGYWVALGIMSSAGFGTGLHTFLLYLGPHIAKVTLAAYECMSVDFPEPPYPEEIICPKTTSAVMTLWIIVKKVRLEAFMWGAGTAIGELPPYYLARSAMLTGVDPDDEDYEEAAQKIESMANSDDNTFYTRVMKVMKSLVEKAGFFGIMLAASIPNPLFDLAGITCGHFLVPFWTFFGATLIGKAVIKMHIQMLFVVLLFSQEYVDMLINWLGYLPVFGSSLKRPFTEYLDKQKKNLHHDPGTLDIEPTESLLKRGFDLFVSLMIVFFVLSIVNSMAQNNMARVQKTQREKKMDRRR